MSEGRPLPTPPHGDPDATAAWVREHLGHLTCDGDEGRASPRFRGGDAAARRVLDELDVRGYAGRRNEVSPASRRGATAVSPYVRHGLITLPELWDAVGGAPERDRSKYRDELLWQEYARHLYARVGRASAADLRHRPPAPSDPQPAATRARFEALLESDTRGGTEGGTTSGVGDGTETGMECVRRVVAELHGDGWLVNQTRMWLASHWAVRHGRDWRAGDDHFFAHLLDGSRAANRLGWQWTAGRLTGSSYGFSRRQVERRAPGWCDSCSRRLDCPIEDWPEEPGLEPVHLPGTSFGRIGPDDVERDAGPVGPETRRDGSAEVVWLTAESLSASDPARRAHPDLPAVFVFDEPLLAGLRLSTKRLVFLAECLADPALADWGLEVHLGDPVEVLAGRRLATTFTPVPGARRRRAALDVRVVHPWPWLRRPNGGPVGSFTAWRRALDRSSAQASTR